MKKTLGIMAGVVVLLAALAFYQGGSESLIRGVYLGLAMLLEVSPLLVAAFALGGLVQVLISPERISHLLGKDAGIRGILLGAMAGGLLPGGPYVYYPVAASFVRSGAEAATIMAFIAAKSLWDLARFPMEAAILGLNIAGIRYLVTLPIPIVMGLLIRWLYPGLTKQLLPKTREEEGK